MLSSCTSTTGRISCRGEGGEQLGTPPPFSSAALATFSSIERKRRGGACLNLDGAVHPLLVRKYAHRSRFKTTSIPRPDGPRTQHTIVCACLRPGPGIHLIGLLVVYSVVFGTKPDESMQRRFETSQWRLCGSLACPVHLTRAREKI